MSSEERFEKRPPSNLPDSIIAREVILRTMHMADLTPNEQEMEEERLLGPDGYAMQLFNRFRDRAIQPSNYNPRFRTILIKVLPDPMTEFDRAFLEFTEGSQAGLGLIFNNELAGIRVQIVCETKTDGESVWDDAVIFWVEDATEGNLADIGIIDFGDDIQAFVKEDDEKFRFRPSLSAKKFMTEKVAELLFESDGSDGKSLPPVE